MRRSICVTSNKYIFMYIENRFGSLHLEIKLSPIAFQIGIYAVSTSLSFGQMREREIMSKTSP